MKVDMVLGDLFEKGFILWIDNGELNLRSSKEPLSDSLQQELSSRKKQIIASLEQGHKYLISSFTQQRLFFLDQLNPGKAVYNTDMSLGFQGKLDIDVMKRVLNEIIRRHESLRTKFQVIGGQVVQVIANHLELELPIIDLRGDEKKKADKRETGLKQAQKEASQPFDLINGPLIKARLIWINDQDYLLSLVLHHTILDGWSAGILHQEMGTIYQAYLKGQSSPLPDLTIQFSNYAVWERSLFKGPLLKEQLTYWKKQLANAPALLELPTDRARPSIQNHEGLTQFFQLSRSLIRDLKEFSLCEDFTIFMVLFAAFKILLFRYTGQADIIVGLPIANRKRKELEGLIGFFANTLAIRSRLTDQLTVQEFLMSIRDTTLQAQMHQELPFEKIVDELQPERNRSYNPLFQVLFVFRNTKQDILDFGDLRTTEPFVENKTSKFDINLIITQKESDFECKIEYNTALFDGSTILRLIRHFKVLLNEIIKNPGQQIGNIPILTFEETQQILLDWNNTKTPYSPSECVYTLFENQVNQTPDAVAVVFENQTLSYQDLNQRANKLAHHLIRSGVGPEVLVGLYVERSLEMIVGLLGIMKAGGAYVPLDPKYHPKHRLAMMLEDAGVSLVLTQDKLVKNIPDTPHVVCLDRDWESIEQEKSSDPKTVVAAKNLVYVIYTSGSTGTPKGVAIEHCQLFNYLSGMNKQLGLPRGASYATVSTIAADLGNTVIFSSLCTGGQLHVISQERAIDSKGMADYFEYYSIDCLKIVPSHIEALQTGNSRTVLPQKLLILGGEASHSNWVKQLQKMAPECSILNHYGPTEATIGVLTHQVSNKPHNGIPAILPLGRPIANTRIYILDRNLNPVPVGVSGELCIGGETLARGYLNRPDLTAEKFIPDPFSSEPGARIYKTGDLARYLQDGTIAFLGRIDFQIKIRGFRIEPGEIESVLSSHPEVKAVVVAVLDNSSNNKKLAAYIVSNSDKPVSDKKLRVFLRNHLPDYMIPSAFVQIETMPLNPNGKVDRHFLIEHYKPQMAVENKTGAPKTGTEKTIAGIWKQIMGLVTVGRHDNFFSVGGHSLNALQLANRLREKFHVDMSVSETYETKTIAELAKKIEGMQNKDTEPSTKNNNTSERLTGKFSRGFMGKLFKKVGFRSKQKA